MQEKKYIKVFIVIMIKHRKLQLARFNWCKLRAGQTLFESVRTPILKGPTKVSELIVGEHNATYGTATEDLAGL